MSGFPPPPPGVDVDASRFTEMTSSEVIPFAFAMLAVFLRFVTRYATGAGLWLDDYLVLPAAALAIAVVVMAGVRIDLVLGHHVWAVGYAAQVDAMKYGIADELIYTLLIGFTKLSVLALYWRVFKPAPIRVPIYAVAFLVIGWMVASLVATPLQCNPVDKDFDALIPGSCFNLKSYFLGIALANIITDAVLLALPMQPIWKMQKPLSQKILLAGTFACGGLVILFSCIRLNAVLNIDANSIDLTWNYTDTWIWSGVEVNLAIISVCLPTLRPCYRFITTGSFTDSSPSHSSRGSGGNHPMPADLRNASPRSPKKWEGEVTMQEIERVSEAV